MTKSYIYRPKAQQIITTRHNTMSYREVINHTIINALNEQGSKPNKYVSRARARIYQ